MTSAQWLELMFSPVSSSGTSDMDSDSVYALGCLLILAFYIFNYKNNQYLTHTFAVPHNNLSLKIWSNG